MGASKRLQNYAGLRGSPTAAQGGDAPSSKKRGLRGFNFGRWDRTTPVLNPHSATVAGNAPTIQAGLDATVATGDNGIGVAASDETLVGRGSQYQMSGSPKVSTIPDNRGVLDVDPAPLGADVENAVLATFTAATGSGAANTFEVTGENTGNIMRVEAWTRGTDTDEDEELLGVFYVAADGSAKSCTITDPGSSYAAGDTIALYVREMDSTTAAASLSAGNQFATRRTVATHS